MKPSNTERTTTTRRTSVVRRRLVLCLGVLVAALVPSFSSAFAPRSSRRRFTTASAVVEDPTTEDNPMLPSRARLLPSVLKYRGAVDQGYGRGGKKLGFPTANLPSSLFQTALEDVTNGVYFGWAALENNNGNNNVVVHKAVVNIGYSPTFEGAENKEKIIEAHLIVDKNDDDDENENDETSQFQDFYGVPMRLVLVGFLREEKKFDSFPDLIAQIRADVDDAGLALDCPPYEFCQRDESFLDVSLDWVGTGGGDGTASWEVGAMDAFLQSLQ